mmetsp:Transcript_30937/g.27367  ORF Transcript_30937/g.27367 Transcript_30937/m.27367 type:complete len:266 (+) Transcript_30937:457-1254(+)|eukprot:CAMPEP_0205800158 /NCGR_PEP_ID=MMETSP0205-20121125/1696_1 /ASSEMBLY_ACC=CAM_ASM_000278 /TAXON_ID=36767 /ORGANISM="Euplotes focardii, Strain TN1" /LENGTH=265 /DNA_ID=CAMNT_0053062725 /DNA_START=368 /DNA_END=1165 /DNA_ORIENTATION=+
MEFEHVMHAVKEGMEEKLNEIKNPDQEKVDRIFTFLSETSPFEYPSVIVMSFPSPRLDYYKNPDFNSIQSLQLAVMGELEQELGYYPVDINLPLLHQMNQLNFAALFLGLVFSIILILFMVISVILIYGVLLVNVEQESFKIRTKRILGLSRISVAKDIIVQTLTFSVPGIVLAFACSFPLLRMIYFYGFEQTLNLKLDPNPTNKAMCTGMLVGLFIPLISSFIPIKAALAKSISEALYPNYIETKFVMIKTALEFACVSTLYGI